MDFVRFLIHDNFMKFYICTWCLRYNICSTWFLDIRISTCFPLCRLTSSGDQIPSISEILFFMIFG